MILDNAGKFSSNSQASFWPLEMLAKWTKISIHISSDCVLNHLLPAQRKNNLGDLSQRGLRAVKLRNDGVATQKLK